MRKNRSKLKDIITSFLLIFFLVSFLYSLYKIINWKLDIDENNKIKDKISNVIKTVNEDEDKYFKYYIDFKTLKDQNPDTIAYVKVNNTNIDYVVVKCSNNYYYLSHNFNEKYNVAGWIFADYHNKFDSTDKNIVIFGHNTRDGSMFGSLKNILNKEWYENEDNHHIVLVTENDTYYYQVFSTYSIPVEDYYINTEFNSDEEFDEFVKTIKSRSIYDYGINVDYNDQILTLSTCTPGAKGRVVLHAKLINN